jgi:hypothetical protein
MMAGKGKGQTTSQAGLGANDSLSMRADARARMRRREVDVYNYYDDGGPGKGHARGVPVSWHTVGHARRKNWQGR